jgi:predicted nucleic acid-binding protein
MILCDTNILIEFYRDNKEVAASLRQIGQADIVISVITQAELYFGALNKRDFETIRRHLSLVSVLPISEAVSARFIDLMEKYSLSHKLSIPDGLIAASAIEYGLPLYTLNKRDFRFIEDIQLFQQA